MVPRRPGQTGPPPPVPNLAPPGAATRLPSPPGAFVPQQNSGFANYAPPPQGSFNPQVTSTPIGGPVGPPPRTGFVRK